VLVRFEGTLEEAKERITEMLAPYDENKEVEPYKKYLSASTATQMANHYGLNKSDVGLLVEKMKEWTGRIGGVDEKGLFYLSTYNPKSKWDFWSIGGRWSGTFVLKQNREGIKGVPGVFRNEVGIDIAYLKDLDFELMRDKRQSDSIELWNQFISKVEVGKDPSIEMWLHGIEDADTFEIFSRRRGTVLATHAVLDDKGWHEPSKMGWFGIDYDATEDELTWSTKFYERFLSNPTEHTIVAIVDCHI